MKCKLSVIRPNAFKRYLSRRSSGFTNVLDFENTLLYPLHNIYFNSAYIRDLRNRSQEALRHIPVFKNYGARKDLPSIQDLSFVTNKVNILPCSSENVIAFDPTFQTLKYSYLKEKHFLTFTSLYALDQDQYLFCICSKNNKPYEESVIKEMSDNSSVNQRYIEYDTTNLYIVFSVDFENNNKYRNVRKKFYDYFDSLEKLGIQKIVVPNVEKICMPSVTVNTINTSIQTKRDVKKYLLDFNVDINLLDTQLPALNQALIQTHTVHNPVPTSNRNYVYNYHLQGNGIREE